MMKNILILMGLLRSYCILRNCVRVSDLIRSPGDTCFELTRARRVAITDTCIRTSSATCSGQV